MDNQVDQVISELSRIESAADKILEGAELEKKEYADLMAQKIKTFDSELAESTHKELTIIREELRAEKEDELSRWRAETGVVIDNMERSFQKNHAVWAKDILNKLIEE